MRNKKTGVFLLFCALLTGLVSLSASPAQAVTRIYGSAYQQWWTGLQLSYSPYAKVYLWDDYGNRWTANTNFRSNWWLDGMPGNRSYNLQARSNSWPYPWSSTVRIWVSERPWWQSNQTQVPDLVCR